MSKTSIAISIAGVILVIAGVVYSLAPDSWRFWRGETANIIDAGTDNALNGAPHETITAKHQYKDGAHTVAGEANSSTPCDILTTTSVMDVSNPNHETIQFTSTTIGKICAQTITSNRFKIDFAAPENTVIKATWNGKPVELNLIPADPNEDLSNFELFIKG